MWEQLYKNGAGLMMWRLRVKKKKAVGQIFDEQEFSDGQYVRSCRCDLSLGLKLTIVRLAVRCRVSIWTFWVRRLEYEWQIFS